jgi:hypothetical protein
MKPASPTSSLLHHSITGTLQNQDGVISVKAGWIDPFVFEQKEMPSHDFH